jgi:hypothetical protein
MLGKDTSGDEAHTPYMGSTERQHPLLPPKLLSSHLLSHVVAAKSHALGSMVRVKTWQGEALACLGPKVVHEESFSVVLTKRLHMRVRLGLAGTCC